MRFGLLRERKNPPDRRVVLPPKACQKVLMSHPRAEICAEPSPIRVFTDEEYGEAGIPLCRDLQDCEVLLGVKEVPPEFLISHKKYFFFSHTIKKQPYNRELLRAVLQKNIELYDHEVITNEKGLRLVAFGRYAGIVGAYNAFYAWGMKEKAYLLPRAHTLPDREALLNELRNLRLPNIKILLTGKGRVGNGALEMLQGMGLREVMPGEYLREEYQTPVFCQIDVLDYNRRKDGTPGTEPDFFEHPEAYEADFMQFARSTDLYLAGHFYGQGAPYLFSREDAAQPDFRIRVVADISCDLNGPVASTLRASTIAEPLYGYDPKTGKESPFAEPGAIAVMAVDNLPAELPGEASNGFAEAFATQVIPAFFNGDKDGILERARMTQNGTLCPRFSYLQGYVEGKE